MRVDVCVNVWETGIREGKIRPRRDICKEGECHGIVKMGTGVEVRAKEVGSHASSK